MSIRSLMTAAHAAGYALAITEASPEELDEAESAATVREAAIPRSSALVVRVPEADRGAWMRDWFHGVRARVTA